MPRLLPESSEDVERMFQRMPMFMESLPKSGEPDEGMAALQALIDEEDPNDLARNLKDSGNDAYSLGPDRFADAIAYYTNALDRKPTDPKLIGLIYGNRAQVQLRLGNYGKSLSDAKDSLSHDPANVKSYYRAAAACGQLRRFKEAMDWCIRGLRASEGGKNESLEKLLEEMKESLQKQRRREQEEGRKRKQELMTKEQVSRLCKERRIVLHEDDENDEGDFPGCGFENKPYVDVENRLHFPVLLMYPEHYTTDTIRDWHEDVTLGEMLDVVFGEPPSWDESGAYTIDKLAVYYRAGEASEELVPVDLGSRLGQVLQQPKFVVYQYTPALIITSKGNEFWNSDIKRFIISKE